MSSYWALFVVIFQMGGLPSAAWGCIFLLATLSGAEVWGPETEVSLRSWLGEAGWTNK